MPSAREIGANEAPMSKAEYAAQYNVTGGASIANYDPTKWYYRVGGFFSGDNNRFDDQYELYKENFQRQKELQEAEKSESSARAWEEYMSSTSYQRAYKDLLKAGLNPRLLLDNAAGASTPSAQGVSNISSSRSSSSSKSESSSNSFSSSAIIAALILAFLKFAK